MPVVSLPLAIIASLLLQPSQARLLDLFEQELTRNKKLHGNSHALTAQAARDLGLFLSRHGNSSGAREALAEAVRIDERAFGPKDPRTLADVAELAKVLPPHEAEPLWLRAAASPEGIVATRALGALGQLRETAGDSVGAAKFYRGALEKEEASGRDTARVAVRLNALARVVDHQEGIALLERALTINHARFGARHVETATIGANLAGLLLRVGRNDEAVRLSSNAISIFEERLGVDHPRTARAAAIVAHALRAKGDSAGAERMYRRALAIDEQAYGLRHEETLADMRALAEFLREVGKDKEAAELEARVLQ